MADGSFEDPCGIDYKKSKSADVIRAFLIMFQFCIVTI